MSAYRATGAVLWCTHFLGLLAEAYGQAGQVEAGLRTVAEALDQVERAQERVYEAELHRLKGELTLLRSGEPADEARRQAQACFQQAIAVARGQGAKSLELRAVTSLARLLQQQGQRDAARQMLAEIYGWFSEGLDTLDLQEARALLDALA